MNTKYPIILVHGIVLKDIKFFKAFGRIEKILKEAGYQVYTSKTDGFGSISNNAKMLKDQILDIMKKEKTDKVNLICHSKGGLDSKYMIQHLGMEDYVASLTTLCTPHKGSKIADILLKLPRFLIRIIAFWLNLIYRIFKDKNPDSLTVAKELSSVSFLEEETINFSDKVYCQSYSTTMKRSRDDFIMGIPLIFSKHYEKDDSDGLVSKESSKFGEYRGDCLNESISHSEIVSFSLSKKKRKRIYSFYLSLCEELSNKGF